MHSRIRGFYGVLDRPDDSLARALFAAADVVQARVKGSDDSREVLAEVAALGVYWARKTGKLFIVNDNLELACECGADGVHLGQDDLPLDYARKILGSEPLIVGVSTHNAQQVEAARAGGATYIGFGPVFETRSKERPDPVVGLNGLANAVRLAGAMPVVAIGGITVDRATAVARTGAAAACAIAAVNRAADVERAGREIAAAFDRSGGR